MQKQRLKQEIGLKLSPQQIQFLGLLQIPLMSLEKRIEEELESNPALEEQSESDTSSENNEQSWEKSNTKSSTKEDTAREFTHQRELSLQEFLLQQLPMLNLNDSEYSISEFLIGCIDDNGFLSRSLLSITDDLLFKLNLEISEYDLAPLLKNIQTLEPVGVGARDLQECLLIQLENKANNTSVAHAIEILTKEYTAFSNKNYEKLGRELELDEDELKAAYKEIASLNPKPGASFSNQEEGNNYITPDFTLEIQNDELKVVLNNSKVKKLKSSEYYKNMLKNLEETKGDKEAISFLKDKIEGASWFANALIQREQTLLNTMNCIVKIQEEYFKSGDERSLKPMKLMDISEKIGLDISTISRVTNSKYIETPYGTFLLKDFFSDAYSKEDGTTISNKVVKSHLKEIIENEDKKKPFSDEELSERLSEKGYHIARRTVAKYREQLDFPVARLRRTL